MPKTKIKEEMVKEPISVPDFTTIKDAINIMKKMGFRHLPITKDNGDITGIVSERDLLKAQGFIGEQTQVSKIMNTNPYVVYMNEPLPRILENMIERKIGSALVKYHDGKIAGIFTSIDAHKMLLRMINDSGEKDAILETYWNPQMEMAMMG